MVKEFKSLKDFSKALHRVTERYPKKENEFLNTVGKFVKEKARRIIGSENTPGYYEQWPELKEATKSEKERLGFHFNEDYNPLLRTGTMRNSIDYSVEPHQVTIGSKSDIMVYQEIGTIHIPPRPVLGLALYKNKEVIGNKIGEFIVTWATNSIKKVTFK